MLRSLRFLVLLLAVAAPAAAETSAPQTREEALAQNVSKVRQVLEQEAVAEDQALRQGGGNVTLAAGLFATAPVTGGQVRQQLATNLSQVNWDFRCHKLKIKDNTGIVNVVCGENLGLVEGNQANQYGTTVNTTAR
ncbi:MAG: hypothetical protein JRH01_03995 [Deltaproteobacteria bacterium]|nr:hypothetical protein [Deltaproteobacteria bacterium]MBW2396147.1 hypothetical protein [Deltaproteobacteria bacterium]